jgi:hypothetical protein
MKRETIYRGDTPSWVFNIKNPDRSIFTLTDWTATFSAKELEGDEILFSKAATVSNPATGRVTVSNTAAETDGSGDFIAEVELRHASSSRVVTCEHFLLTIKGDVNE